MLSIKVNDSNDIIVDAAGNIATVSGRDCILQNTITAMRAQKGEMPFDMTGGMPTLKTAWVDLDVDAFESAARSVIMRVSGVRNIQSFELEKVGDTIRYTVALSTDDGIIRVSSELGNL